MASFPSPPRGPDGKIVTAHPNVNPRSVLCETPSFVPLRVDKVRRNMYVGYAFAVTDARTIRARQSLSQTGFNALLL
jgi:hypothetical protein